MEEADDLDDDDDLVIDPSELLSEEQILEYSHPNILNSKYFTYIMLP